MTPGTGFEYPYAHVDLAQMDHNFPALLAHAVELEQGERNTGANGPGLSVRETRLFRVGLLVGLGEWDLARGGVDALLDDGILNGAEMSLMAAEAVHVKGWTACMHLGPVLAARGLRAPGSVAEAVEVVEQTNSLAAGEGPSSCAGLTGREIFALGLGITWGARCWDT
jgi:hypothetical protein